MNDGWIKLYRKITEWEWYTVPSMAHLFIHLLLMANQKDKRWKGILIKRGQLVTSANSLAEQTGLDKRTVRKNLKRLEETEEISKVKQYHYSLITVNRFDAYQLGQNCTDQCTDQCTQHKNIRNKERKNTSTTTTTTRERDSEKNFYEGLKASTEMMAAMRETFGLATDRYWGMLTSFSAECTAKDMTHANMEKYKEHFFNWVRRHVEINGKDDNKNKGKGYGSNSNNGNNANGNGRGGRDAAIRRDVDNMLAKYGLTSKDVGI